MDATVCYTSVKYKKFTSHTKFAAIVDANQSSINLDG